MGEKNRMYVPLVVPEVHIPRPASTPEVYAGTQGRQIAVAVFDPSANTAQRPVAAYGLGVYIPSKAIITKAWVDVVTTFTSAGADAGTIALSAQSANDIIAAIAISAGGSVWAAGVRGTKVGEYALDGLALTQIAAGAAEAASMIKMTAEREITATVAIQALTAGKAVIYVEYVLGA